MVLKDKALALLLLQSQIRRNYPSLALVLFLRTLTDSVDYWTTTEEGQRLFHVQLVKAAT